MIQEKNKVKIIAEAGVNHNGDLQTAIELVRVASDCGADFVKFQTFTASEIASKFAGKAEYQKKNSGADESQLEMLRKLELSREDHFKLLEACKKYSIQFLSTAFDFKSIELLHEIGLTLWKIPSGEITNFPYIKKIGAFGANVILSSGMSNLGEIESAVSVLLDAGTKRENITVLHCSTEYPAAMDEVNLNAMNTIRNSFKVKVGYSDHTNGIEVSIAAVALGASVIEKHFTLDKNMPGPDHKASLSPAELKDMISAIRNVELAMGDGIKNAGVSESRNLHIARKSLVAKKPISKGDLFTEENLTVKRPGNGISPMKWNEIIGKYAQKDYLEDELI